MITTKNPDMGGKNNLKEWLIGNPQNPGLLKQLGLSVEQFADGIGLRRTTIYYFLNDNHRPSIESLKKMCDFLGVTIQEGMKWVSPRAEGRPATTGTKRKARTRKDLTASEVLGTHSRSTR